MGLFGRKKKSLTDNKSVKSGSTAESDLPSRSILTNSTSKSVRFASVDDEDDDMESGFATDSELEVHRVRPSNKSRVSSLLDGLDTHPALQEHIKNGNLARYKASVSKSYHENRPAESTVYTSIDDSYMSDSGANERVAAFQRGGRLRASLPVMRGAIYKQAQPSNALVFLSFHNETRKTVLPAETKSVETLKTMFLNAFPELATKDINSSRYRIYILDRASQKFYILIHVQHVRDGSMLKLVDSETATPSLVRKSRSHNTSLGSGFSSTAGDAFSYVSESELEYDSSASSNHKGYAYRVRRSASHGGVGRETDVDAAPQRSGPNYSSLSLPRHPIAAPRPSSGLNCSFSALPTAYSTANASYIPPQAHHSSVHSTKDLRRGPPLLSTQQSAVLNVSDQGSEIGTDVDAELTRDELSRAGLSRSTNTNSGRSPVAPESSRNAGSAGSAQIDSTTRTRMAKMEEQIASLTSLVQSALSRPSSSASEPDSQASIHSSQSSLSNCSTSTPQPELSIQLQQKLQVFSQQICSLKGELKRLRRIHESHAECVTETVSEASRRILGAVSKFSSLKTVAVNTARRGAEEQLKEHNQQFNSTLQSLGSLEACVSELRSDVVSKRCHVNLPEVEALALKLSKAAQSAAKMKSALPKLTSEVNSVIVSESEELLRYNALLEKKPEKVEDLLRRCKSVTNVLYTLKRLAVIESHRSIVVPNTKWRRVEQLDKSALLRSIEQIEPDHGKRLRAVQLSEESAARRKDIMSASGSLRFEKSLELATKSLKEAESTTQLEPDSDLVRKATQLQRVSETLTSSAEKSSVLSRSKPHNSLSSSIIQNRDSIHWGDDSSSDDDVTNGPSNGSSFMLVSGNSAFVTVNQRRRNHEKQSSGYTQKSAIFNGPIRTPPKPSGPHESNGEPVDKTLHEQYSKLQELQRSYNRNGAPAADNPPPLNSTTRPKPSIAPKPHGLNITPRKLQEIAETPELSSPTNSLSSFSSNTSQAQPLKQPRLNAEAGKLSVSNNQSTTV